MKETHPVITCKKDTLDLFELIKQWGKDRNIDTQDPKVQFLKLLEEVEELEQGLKEDNRAETIDAIGDITVVLVQLCSQLGLDFIKCVESAYNEIKDRKGKLINGVFVKEG